jgi:hypothetical protein
MKRTITTMALAATMLLSATPAAFANADQSQGTAGYGTEECRPGADNDHVGSWEPMTTEDFIAEVFDVTGGILPQERADEIWDFCDKNRDTIACVMRQTFPDGAPHSVVWTLLDNRPFHPAADIFQFSG